MGGTWCPRWRLAAELTGYEELMDPPLGSNVKAEATQTTKGESKPGILTLRSASRCASPDFSVFVRRSLASCRNTGLLRITTESHTAALRQL
jgi:hypothetical protein